MVDYKEDFMQTLKSVHFGPGQWMAVAASTPGSAGPFKVFANFPDQSGGTPGLPLWNPNATPYPFEPNITASMLKGSLRTNAGSALTGFGEQVLIGGKIFVRVWIKLDKFMPSSTFRVRFIAEPQGLLGSTGKMVVSTVVKNKMKAGGTGDDIPIFDEKNKTYNSAETWDFRVNPSTLAVTGPF